MTRAKRPAGGMDVGSDKPGVGWLRAEGQRMNANYVLQGLADPRDGVMCLVLSFAREWCRLLEEVRTPGPRDKMPLRRSSLAGRS
jgi:hypothetical protein